MNLFSDKIDGVQVSFCQVCDMVEANPVQELVVPRSAVMEGFATYGSK